MSAGRKGEFSEVGRVMDGSAWRDLAVFPRDRRMRSSFCDGRYVLCMRQVAKSRCREMT